MANWIADNRISYNTTSELNSITKKLDDLVGKDKKTISVDYTIDKGKSEILINIKNDSKLVPLLKSTLKGIVESTQSRVQSLINQVTNGKDPKEVLQEGGVREPARIIVSLGRDLDIMMIGGLISEELDNREIKQLEDLLSALENAAIDQDMLR